ncbi:Cobalt-precorrin-6y C5-methyltransferase (EC / Cobalt-precorrin-6y C15-methyltransferase [Streptomyces globisporus]|uniref:Cobalt-precorrin-6y C5-methyltransferase n=2 Tax=Streptomyces TaxID=1883 RepID=A0ABM9H110_STRGL|nr:predicted protein [Streptomyces filamentosus NRRL 15998]EWS90495.1 hypothetical protein SSIG_07316 [Streptomyces filamentosus NRRL 11379]CAH9417282.1 Cobalt-precorrin-6y C5-methyltransferase (EC / Cobalt-precorrin-6y C15-methyltransferase [Streptomyces globisporus]
MAELPVAAAIGRENRKPAGVSCRAASPLVLDDEHRRAVVRRPGRRAEGALTMGEGYA